MNSNNVYAACPYCLRFLERESEKDAETTVKRHNVSRHNGSDVAMVIFDYNPDITEFVEHAAEVSNDEQFKQLRKKFENSDLPFFVSAKRFNEIWTVDRR